jgi:hypothetical protein
MAFKRILVLGGQLMIGDLAFQLYSGDSPMTTDYRGDAWVEGTYLVIGDPNTTVNLAEYRIDNHPTQASVDYSMGRDLGAAQKRQAWPQSKSESFVDGWKDAWRERGRPVRNFIVRHDGKIVKDSRSNRSQ